jgi:hypothetical protein
LEEEKKSIPKEIQQGRAEVLMPCAYRQGTVSRKGSGAYRQQHEREAARNDGTSDDLRHRRAMAARSRRRSTAARNGLQLCGRPTKPLGRAGWAFKKKQLDEVRGGVRRSLPARGSNPNLDVAGHSRGERARFFGCSELLQWSFSFAALVPLGSRSNQAGKGMAGRRLRGMWPAKGGAAAEWAARPSGWWSGAHSPYSVEAAEWSTGALAAARRQTGAPARAVRLGGRTACGRELGGCRMRDESGSRWVVPSGSRGVERVAHLSALTGVREVRLA